MNEIEVLGKEEIAKFKGEGTAIEQRAAALQVVNEETRAEASEMREIARQFKKAVIEKFKASKESAAKAHKEICNLEGEMYGPADRVIKVLDGKANVYLMEQDRIRQEAEAKARKAAEAEAEKERQKLLKAAAKAEEKGNLEKAEEKRMEAEQVQTYTPIFAGPDKTVRTDSGRTSARKVIVLSVIDPGAVFAAVVRGEIPAGVLEIKQGELKRYAEMKRVGDTVPAIPGCRVTLEYAQIGGK